MAYRDRRAIAALDELSRLVRVVCRHNPACSLHHRPHRPAEDDRARPHGEFGHDAIALVGSLCYAEHRRVPEIRQALAGRGHEPAVCGRC